MEDFRSLVYFVGNFWWLFIGLSFKFNPVCIFIATLRKRISWQYRFVSTYMYVFVHPYVPSERCEINRNIIRCLKLEVSLQFVMP